MFLIVIEKLLTSKARVKIHPFQVDKECVIFPRLKAIFPKTEGIK